MIAALDVETAKAWGPILLAAIAVVHLVITGRNRKIDHDAARDAASKANEAQALAVDAKQTAAEHKTLTTIIATRDATIARYDTKFEEINKELRAMSHRMGNLETEVATLKERNAELSRLIEAKTAEIDHLREALTAERVDHQRTKGLLAQAIADKDEAVMQQEVLAAELRRLEGERGGTIG